MELKFVPLNRIYCSKNENLFSQYDNKLHKKFILKFDCNRNILLGYKFQIDITDPVTIVQYFKAVKNKNKNKIIPSCLPYRVRVP